MRKPILLLAAVALAVAACGGSSATSAPYQPAPPDHHGWTPEPWDEGAATEAPREEPPATPYDGVTYDDPGVNPFIPTDRDRESTFGLDVDTASYAIARRYVHDGNSPDPASVRVEEFVNAFEHDYPAPQDGTFAIHADGGPTPFLARDEVLLRIGVKAREVREAARPDGRAHVRHRHLGLDGARGPAGARQARARHARGQPGARRLRRHRHVRHRCPGRPGAHEHPRRRPDRRRDRRPAHGRLHERRGRTRAGLPARRVDVPRGRDQPRRARVRRRRERRRHRSRGHPAPDQLGREPRHPARHRGLRDGQLQRRAHGAARRQGRRVLRVRQHARRRPGAVRRRS